MRKILIASVPRSGSSWLGRIFESAPNVAYRFQPNFSYSFQPTIHPESSRDEIDFFYSELLQTTDPFVLNQVNADGQRQELHQLTSTVNTLVWKEVHGLGIIPNLIQNTDTTVVCLVRSPLAVLSSWFNAPREFDTQWDVMSEWEHGKEKNQGRWNFHYGYSAWKSATLNFLHLKALHSQRIHIVKYCDLLNDSTGICQLLFRRLQIPYHSSVAQFLNKSMSSNEAGSYAVSKMKKALDDEWTETLNEEIVTHIVNDLKGTSLSIFL